MSNLDGIAVGYACICNMRNIIAYFSAIAMAQMSAIGPRRRIVLKTATDKMRRVAHAIDSRKVARSQYTNV